VADPGEFDGGLVNPRDIGEMLPSLSGMIGGEVQSGQRGMVRKVARMSGPERKEQREKIKGRRFG
jgi:hypothetical protein